MTKLTAIFAGACTLALAGGAYAGDPLTLTGAQLDGVTAGQGGSADFYVTEYKDIRVYVDKKYKADVYLDGTSAQATAFANAESYNHEDVLAETAFYAETYSYGPYYYASSGGTAISAIDSNN